MLTPRRLALIALAALAGVACRSPGPRLQSVVLEDIQVPAMVEATARAMKAPFVVELPARPVNDRFDLRLTDVPVDEALAAIVAKDPQFQVERRDTVIILWPKAKADLAASPFSKALPEGSIEGGAGEAIRQVLREAGLQDTTNLVVERTGLRRPVRLAMKGRTVRDAFAEIALQAHLGFRIEPGSMYVAAVDE